MGRQDLVDWGPSVRDGIQCAALGARVWQPRGGWPSAARSEEVVPQFYFHVQTEWTGCPGLFQFRVQPLGEGDQLPGGVDDVIGELVRAAGLVAVAGRPVQQHGAQAEAVRAGDGKAALHALPSPDAGV